MQRIVLWFMSTLTVVVLLFGYRTSTSSSLAGTVVAAPPASTGSSGTGSSSSSTGSSGSSAGSSSGGKTVTGPVAQTRWGPVQVQVTVAGGKITDVTVVEYPTENPRDQEINAYAIPELVKQTLDAQSAEVDMISGATVTSEGYAQSLQGALDEAGL